MSLLFRDFFVDFKDLNFEISKRGNLNFDQINIKLNNSKCQDFIIDISINGYSSKPDFDFTLSDRSWREQKKHFEKGAKAQGDPSALTVKRAMRVLSRSTSEYILLHKITPILNKYNDKCPSQFCHLAGHFVVDERNAQQLLLLWKNFDKIKRTTIFSSVERIIKLRFPSLELV